MKALEEKHTNTIGMTFRRIDPGSFTMGFGMNPCPDEMISTKRKNNVEIQEWRRNGHYDEHPNHKVTIGNTFYMAEKHVTNAQYEQFDPGHCLLRGAGGYSTEDDDPVIMVSWYDAVNFCQWLAEKEGLPYGLPTEAQWEYAARAGTTTHFNTGDSLPSGEVPPNAWGLYDMHGKVEEWVHDWHGPYQEGAQLDPVGCVDGTFKITRGGSRSTSDFYLRSANRSGTIPEDSSWLIGFRVSIGDLPATAATPVLTQLYQQNVNQEISVDIDRGPDPDKPYFEVPRRYVNIPEGCAGPLFYRHNHNPHIAQCPNGDLLAINFSTVTEGDREMVYAASRLRYGSNEWEPSSIFWAPPDRKAEGSSLWVENGIIYHFAMLGVANTNPPAIIMRTSDDSGATWSKPRIIVERGDRQSCMETVFRKSDGTIILPGDRNIFISNDNGLTWTSPCGKDMPARPAGVHNPVIELNNGDLMAFGRSENIGDKMPQSVSSDKGKTWSYFPSIFSKIAGGQRATMRRLQDGSIFFASFADGMEMTDASGNTNKCDGLFAALSFDEGKTWPVMKVVSDGSGRMVFSRMNRYFKMTSTSSEGSGYLSSIQSADGVIHIVSNRVEYAFNVAWLTDTSGKTK